MLRSRRAFLPVAIAALVLPGCARRAPMDNAEMVKLAAPAGAPLEALRSQAVTADKGAAAPAQAGASAANAGSVTAPGLASVFASLKLIRTASISVEVEKYDLAAEEIVRVAESFGGYLAESQVTQGHEDHRSGSLTIRVPSQRFGAALAALKGLGKVKAENVSTQDVTKAYTDLETRLKVKRDTADRLRELLRTRTADLPDVLNAERELARVTEEIEQMEGERRFYDQQVAFSTIAITLAEPHSIVEPGVFSPLSHALRDSLQVLAQSLAGLIYVLVALAPWIALAYVIWRAIKAVRARRKRTAAAAA